MKKILLFTLHLSLFTCLTGCSALRDWLFGTKPAEEEPICPSVSIQKDNLMVSSTFKDEIKVELKGYEGYCYYDDKTNSHMAVLAPIFEITRLKAGDETDIHFSYYTQTLKGPPEFLGKKTYFAKTSIGLHENSRAYKPEPVEVRIPDNREYSLDINLGLYAKPNKPILNRGAK